MFDRPDFLNNAVNISRMIISHKISEGDIVVDATVGHGNDTLFLARIVGRSGKVYGFDVHKEAIRNTERLLEHNNCSGNVELINDGHQHLDRYVRKKIKLALFNLGYLPNFGRESATRYDTTMEALRKSIDVLDSYGLVLLVIYHGHLDGVREKKEISDFAASLPQRKYNVFYLDLINQINNPPVLIGIEKRE